MGGGAVARRFGHARGVGGATLLLVAAVAAVAYLALVPLGYLAWQVFVDDGTLSLASFRAAYGAYGLGELAWNSLVFAFGSTMAAVGIGTALAFLVVRTDVPGRTLLFVGALVPLVVPGVLYTIAWIFLASPRIGALNQLLEPIAGPGAIDVFSLGGMILVEALHLAPIAFLLMAASLRSMDPALEEAAVASGAGSATVFRRVTLPLMRPAVSASILILAVRAIESFEVPALLGLPGGTWVFTSRIWRSLGEVPPAYGEAGAYALSLLLLALLGVAAHGVLSRRTRSFQTVTGKGFRPRPIALGAWRWPVTAISLAYMVVASLLPLLILAYVSTQRFYSSPSWDGLSRMTLDSYQALLEDEQLARAAKNSLLLGVGCATAVMLSMAVVSWIVVRTRLRGRWLVDGLAFLPIAIPGLVLGVALLIVYLRVPLPVYGTLWILFIAYVTRFMPYGIRTASISMAQIGRELEESAHVAGAGWLTTFRRVLLPLMLPGLAAGWIYIMLVSLRELSASILLYSPGSEVLSIVIWERYESGAFPELSALGLVMVAGTGAIAVLAYRLSVRLGIRGA